VLGGIDVASVSTIFLVDIGPVSSVIFIVLELNFVILYS
jgi:hypothetical protein